MNVPAIATAAAASDIAAATSPTTMRVLRTLMSCLPPLR
jgi:hypothetical protein